MATAAALRLRICGEHEHRRRRDKQRRSNSSDREHGETPFESFERTTLIIVRPPAPASALCCIERGRPPGECHETVRTILVLPPQSARRVPWKNGRGVSAELALWPE